MVFYREKTERPSPERLSDLPKVTQLLSGVSGAGIANPSRIQAQLSDLHAGSQRDLPRPSQAAAMSTLISQTRNQGPAEKRSILEPGWLPVPHFASKRARPEVLPGPRPGPERDLTSPSCPGRERLPSPAQRIHRNPYLTEFSRTCLSPSLYQFWASCQPTWVGTALLGCLLPKYLGSCPPCLALAAPVTKKRGP